MAIGAQAISYLRRSAALSFLSPFRDDTYPLPPSPRRTFYRVCSSSPFILGVPIVAVKHREPPADPPNCRIIESRPNKISQQQSRCTRTTRAAAFSVFPLCFSFLPHFDNTPNTYTDRVCVCVFFMYHLFHLDFNKISILARTLNTDRVKKIKKLFARFSVVTNALNNINFHSVGGRHCSAPRMKMYIYCSRVNNGLSLRRPARPG